MSLGVLQYQFVDHFLSVVLLHPAVVHDVGAVPIDVTGHALGVGSALVKEVRVQSAGDEMSCLKILPVSQSTRRTGNALVHSILVRAAGSDEDRELSPRLLLPLAGSKLLWAFSLLRDFAFTCQPHASA